MLYNVVAMHNSPIGYHSFAKFLEPGEEIYYIAHNHPLLIIRDIILFLLIGLLIPYGLWFSNPDLSILSLVILVLSILRFGYKYALYYYDCWLVTNKGVIDIEWISFFNRKIIRIEFEHFEGITTEVKGFLNTLFLKGDVILIRIVDDENQVAIYDAYRPKKIETEVLRAKELYHNKQRTNQGERHGKVVELLSELLDEHAKKKGVDL